MAEPVGPVPRIEQEVPGEAPPGGLENLWNASKLTASGSILRFLSQAQTHQPVEGYNPFTDPLVMSYLPSYGEEFLGSRSPAESLGIANRIKESQGIRHNLERGGAFWSLFGAELFDPINYLPFPIVPRGIGFWKGAARLGAAGAAQELAYQGILEGTDPLHTWEDVAYAVPAATLFAGALGGLIGRMPDDLARVTREAEDAARRYEAGSRAGTEMPPNEAGDVLPGVDIKVGNTGRYSPTGEYIAGTTARNEDGSRTILIDEEHIKNVYWPQKAWTQPRPYADGTMSEPLKLNDITSPEELVQFIREHELAHVRLAQQEGEGRAAYETRINEEALRVLKEGRPPDKPGGFFGKVENIAQARQRLEELKDGEFAEVERKLTEAREKLDSYPDNAGGRITKAQKKVETLTAQAAHINQRIEQLGKAIADEEAALAAVPPEGAVDASRVAPTGIGVEKMRWSQMPWYLGKNNKFWDWGLKPLAQAVSGVMDRLAMAPGLFMLGNTAGVATHVSVEAKSKQWLWAQRQASRASWNEFFKYLGVSVGDNIERQALFHRAGEATRRMGSKVGLTHQVAAVSGKMTWEEFINAAGRFHIDGDLTRLPEDARQFIEATSRAWDDFVFVPMGNLGKELGVFYSDRVGANKLALHEKRVELWEQKLQAVTRKKEELAVLASGDTQALREQKMALFWRHRIANDPVFAQALRDQGIDIEQMMTRHRMLLRQAAESAEREGELRQALNELYGTEHIDADKVHDIVSQQAVAAYTYSPEVSAKLSAEKREKATRWRDYGMQRNRPGMVRVANLIDLEAQMFEDILRVREKMDSMFRVTEEQVDSWLRARTVALKAQEDIINQRWLETTEQLDHLTTLQARDKAADWKTGKYHHRVWDWAKIQANRMGLERVLTQWFTQNPRVWINGKLVELSTAPEAIAERVQEAMATIMKEVELGDDLHALGIMDQERIRHLEARRDKILGQLEKAQDEVKPYFQTKLQLLDDYIAAIRQGKVSGPSPIMSRRLDIPDEMVKDFIVTNMEELAQRYVYRMGAHLEMAREFGDHHMTQWFDEFEDKALSAIDGMADVDQVTRMVDEMRLQRQAISDVRDKVLGVYGISQNPDALTERTAKFLMNWSVLTMMGKAWQAALMDFGRVIQSEGLARSLGSLWRMMAGAERVAYRAGKQEVEQAGLALDLVNAQRMMAVADLGNNAFHKTAFEAGVAKLVPTMFILNGLGLWTDVVKRFSGTLIQSRIIEDSIRWADGTIDDQARRRLARSGVDERLARQFAEQWYLAGQQKHGSLYLASTMGWTDPEVTRQFRAILANDVDSAVITPGAADKPNFMSSPTWAMILQYKGFSMAATQRILMSGLQQRDKLFLQGVASMVAIAWLVESSFRSHEWDRPPVTKQLYNAVERSGVGGIFLDMNQILETASGGELGIRPALGMDPILREPSPAQRLGALAGPAASQWSQAFWAFTSDDATSNQQAKALRYLLPFNNLWMVGDYYSRAQHELVDSLEGR